MPGCFLRKYRKRRKGHRNLSKPDKIERKSILTQEDVHQNDVKEAITRRGYLFVMLWAAGILLTYAIGGCLGVRQLQGYKAETEKFRQASIESATTEPGAPVPELTLPAGARPVEVRVGIYINRIGDFSLKESEWTADFDPGSVGPAVGSDREKPSKS